MSDGAVVFDTRLNNKKLEQDYARTVKKIEDLENEVTVKSAKKSGLEKQANAFSASLDAAKAKLYEMQEAGKGVFSADDIAMQRENVAQLQSQWDGIMNQVDSYSRQISAATDKIDVQRSKAARLTQKIEEAAAAQTTFDDATGGAVVIIEKLTNRIGKLATRALVFTVISQGFRLMRDWLGEVVTKNDQTAAAIARLKGALLTLAQPLLTVIIPAFTAVVNLLTAIVGRIATFLSMLGGKTAQESAKAAKALHEQGKAYEDVADSAKKASKQLMGFDELNVLQDTSVSADTGSGAGGAETIAPDFSWSEGVTETMEKLAGWVMLIAAGLALWKIGTMFTGPLATILATVGKMAAGIGLVVTGLILLANGFREACENGLTLENTLRIIAGIIATGLGITLLTGSLIPLLVAGILGIIVALAKMTGQGEALIGGLKQMFGGFVDFLMGSFLGDFDRMSSGAANILLGLYNTIASILNSLILGAVKLLNSFHITIPGIFEWSGFNIQSPPQIPYLAQGAVIPPNREFLAVLGDQRHGNNIEAPEDLIRKIVREETAGLGGSDRLVQLMEILIDTVENIEVGDETIGKAAARYTRSTARARGT